MFKFFNDRDSILQLELNKIIPQRYNLLAVCMDILFFDRKIVNNDLWSVCNVNFLPGMKLWNFLIA